MKIRMMADYECWPLWWDGAGRVGNIAPSDLGLSEGRSADLNAWAAAYDATLNRADPASSGFSSSEKQQLFHARGEPHQRESHEQLRTYLADVMAAYNFARRLKMLNGIAPYEYIAKI